MKNTFFLTVTTAAIKGSFIFYRYFVEGFEYILETFYIEGFDNNWFIVSHIVR